MSESAVIVWERQSLAANRARHARYLKSARLDCTAAGKAYWLTAAREVRLTIAESLDMLTWLTRKPQGKRAATC
jgi:hypothetical protein